MRVVLTGGGTGGHVYPAVAVADRLRQRVDDLELLYVGSAGGLERSIVADHDLPFAAVAAQGVIGKRIWKQAAAAGGLMVGTVQALSILRRMRPDVVLATGGYVCVPVVLAAWPIRVPVVLHEQNAFLGAANRFLTRFAQELCISSPNTTLSGRQINVTLTGNPVRADITSCDRQTGAKRLGIDPDLVTVLIFGGSRGAAVLAGTIEPLARALAIKGGQLVAATGPPYFEQVMTDLGRSGIRTHPAGNIIIKPYIHDMAAALAVADVVVSRAGATTIAEITAAGRPAVLVPSPNVVHDHQSANAQAVARAGGAVVVREVDVKVGRLVDVVMDLVTDDQRRQEMSEKSREIGRPDAADAVVDRLLAVVGRA